MVHWSAAMQWWGEFEPIVGGDSRPRDAQYDTSLQGPDAGDLAARFARWYILEGHAGLHVSVNALHRVAWHCSRLPT